MMRKQTILTKNEIQIKLIDTERQLQREKDERKQFEIETKQALQELRDEKLKKYDQE